MKEFELYSAEYLGADESKQQKTGGIAALLGKIQPLIGELRPRVRLGLEVRRGDLDTPGETQRSE